MTEEILFTLLNNMTTEKDFKELGLDELKDLKIEFAPGCFDNFDGSQEELDSLIAEIKNMFVSGEAQRIARPLDVDELDEEDLEMLDRIYKQEERAKGRNLQ